MTVVIVQPGCTALPQMHQFIQLLPCVLPSYFDTKLSHVAEPMWVAAEAPGDDDVEEDDLADEDDEEDYEEDEKPPAKKAKAAAKPAAKGAAGKAAGGKKGGQASKGISHACLGFGLLQSYPPASLFFPAFRLAWLLKAQLL